MAASVDEIAQRANLAKVTLYVYFGSSPGMLLDRRADIRQAEQQLAALNAQIGGSESGILPQIYVDRGRWIIMRGAEQLIRRPV